MEPVKVNARVYEGLEAVRSSGRINMMEIGNVIMLANVFGYEETADWVENNREAYAKGFLRGFEPDKEEA